MKYLLIYGVFHLVCGVLAWGIDFAYFQRGWPTLAKENYKRDLKVAIVTNIIGGPIALFVGLLYPITLGSKGWQGFKWF